MYFQYGSFQHPIGEVNFLSHQKTRRYTTRGDRISSISTFHLQASVQSTSTSDLQTKLTAREDAYLRDGEGDAGLYYDDATPTIHVLPNSTSLDGIRVVRFNYMEDNGAEHSIRRVLDIVLQAEYLQIEDQIAEYFETVDMQGGIAPRKIYVPTFFGYQVQIIAEFTPKIITQHGYAIGVEAYPLVNAPMLPFDEVVQERDISHTSPERGVRKKIMYRSSWKYVMVTPSDTVLLPRLR